MSPTDTPDDFGPAYDPPPPMGPRMTDLSPRASPASDPTLNRPQSRQQIPYAPPGSTSSSMNPASTVAFMLNMGYPPPSIALEPLRRLLEQMTQGPGQVLNLQLAMHVTDEISRSPYRIAPAVLFVIQQRLHSSKPDRVALSLELLDMCVKNCGLDFVRHINKEFMKSMVSVVKTTTFKERTITGQIKKLEKYVFGSPSITGVATDPRVHRLKRQCLSLIQNWADAFMMHPQQVQPILDTYKSLRRKGIQFPPRDTTQKFLVKHAESSPAFDSMVTSSQRDMNSASIFQTEEDLQDSPDGDIPFSEKQFAQLEKLINLLKTSNDEELIQKALAMCERLKPKLEHSLRLLQSKINTSSSRKLKVSDPRVAQLNAILDLDAEVKKRRGAPLLYSVATGIVTSPWANTDELSSNNSTVSPKPPVTSPVKAVTSVNLLDDLLDSD